MTALEDFSLVEGARFGAYRIVRPLGTGGMGAVYEAVHVGLGKRVALKTLHRQVAGNVEVLTRFMREGRAAARIRHPNVVDVADVGAVESVPFLVMEFLEGEDLAQRLERDGPLPLATTLEVMLPIMAAVAAAHDAGVLHRDLKPANVFLSRTGSGQLVPKVLDFGISKLTDEKTQLAVTGAMTVMGTPFYLSPEQADGSRNISFAADQYSLGVIVYQCLTGDLPFRSETLLGVLTAIATAEIRPPSELRPDLPPGIDEVVLRSMSRDPEMRFGSVREFGAALLQFAPQRVRAIFSSELGVPHDTADEAPAEAPVPLTTVTPASGMETQVDVLGTTLDVVGPRATDPGTTQPVMRPPTPVGRRSQRGAMWLGMLLAVVAVLGGAALLSARNPLAPIGPRSPASVVEPLPAVAAGPSRIDVVVEPAFAIIELDGRTLNVGRASSELPADGKEHVVRISALGYEPMVYVLRGESLARTVRLVPHAPSAAPTPPSNGTGTPSREPSRPSSRPRSGEPVHRGVNNAPIVE